ncbi:MAG: hypothetical protein HOJ90_12015 [Alphaproteobacteria bacterium]|jgi:hypothetical protein|nr:hypothetical protein [Alphaproteobacteria bacterium]
MRLRLFDKYGGFANISKLVSDHGIHDVRGFGEQQLYRLDGDLSAANDGGGY